MVEGEEVSEENQGIFDYTHFKLRNMVEYERDSVRREMLYTFIDLYAQGVVNIHFEDGDPVATFVEN